MNQLILPPGALGHAAQFANLITELETKNINALAFNLAGHGLSFYSEEAVTVPLMAEALLLKLDELGLTEPVNIFGHSLGGYLGLYLCLKFPQRVKSVFTLGTKWHWVSEIADIETSMLNPEKMEQKIPKYVEHLKTVHRQDWKILVNSIAFLMTDLGRYQYLEPETVMGIFHPTRIGLGDRDVMVSLDETVITDKALPNGQLQVFPNTPHPYEKVDSKKLANEIADFLNL
jgi:pimeloyl-ACP methyl ester carboxylesterase